MPIPFPVGIASQLGAPQVTLLSQDLVAPQSLHYSYTKVTIAKNVDDQIVLRTKCEILAKVFSGLPTPISAMRGDAMYRHQSCI